MKLGGKISRSIRYVVYIIGTDPIYLGGGGGNSEKLEKLTYF